MNTFRTVVPRSNFPFKITHNESIFCLGSCFTENIGHFLLKSKFSTLINPFGIIYNPISICKLINLTINDIPISTSDLVSINERFYHWDFHGDLSDVDSKKTADLINQQINTANEFLKETDIIFLTLGTSNAFQLIDTERIVANCHKYPNNKFKRVGLPVDDIVYELEQTIAKLERINPNIKIVFTISPVRHLRDGLINNQLSKARLIQSVHQLCSNNSSIFYFPSYELIIDDLRDYRFYSQDMLHVNDLGLSYIWDHFKRSLIEEDTLTLIDSIMRIHKDLEHKAFYPNSSKHQTFLNNLKDKIIKIRSDYPSLDFDQEINRIEEQITTTIRNTQK